MKTIQKTACGLVMALTLGLAALPSMAIESLRGSVGLDQPDPMFELPKQAINKDGFGVGYDDQPPMISHSVEKDVINIRTNTCMDCHSQENYKKEKAPRVAASHYRDREGHRLEQLAPRRYFCDNCHVPQMEVAPLVGNTF
jgi:cytochrome c-type protein NapB